jgi:hypothetical protein
VKRASETFVGPVQSAERNGIYLRQHYHFGGSEDLDVLEALPRRYDQPVRRVAHPEALGREPAPHLARYKRHRQRWKRYEKRLSGQRVLVDMKFIELLPGTRKKHYQYTAIDDCTRIRVLRFCPRSDQKTAIQFADYLLEKLPFHVDVIQTDIHSQSCPVIRVLASWRDEALGVGARLCVATNRSKPSGLLAC